MLLGAIIGDVVGSRFEFSNYRAKDFELFHEKCFITDDSIMTLAIAKAFIESKSDYSDLQDNTIKYMQKLGKQYPNRGYGLRFNQWIYSDMPKPYNSFGNGSAMRVSPVGWVAKTEKEVRLLSKVVTEVTHNHPEGIKGAEATAIGVYLAKKGKSKDDIQQTLSWNYYDVDFTIDEIRPTYRFNETCQETVPQALQAFYESVDFEDAIRTAISVGGDSDTLAAITGSIAEAYYKIPERIKFVIENYIRLNEPELFEIYKEFNKKYKNN